MKKITRFIPLSTLLLFLFTIPVYILLYKILMPKVNAFGCFDDCFSMVPGYFVFKGKTLYSEIFFNHNVLMPYISAMIQHYSQPINIYDLFLKHRQFLMFFSLLMNLLLIYRFRFVAVGFMLFYEFSKFYLFGDRFLAESFIVYPLVYMTGLVFEKLQGKKIRDYEYILSSIFTWFVFFMREPFVIVPIFLFTLLLINKTFKKIHAISIAVFILLTIGTFSVVPFGDFFFDVVVQDYNIIFSKGATNNSIVNMGVEKIFLYPIFLFFGGEWSVFRYVLVGLSALFLTLLSYIGILKKHWKLFALIFFTLALANIRVLYPYKSFYEAFHIVPWFGIFVFSLFLLLRETHKHNKKLFITTIAILITLFGFLTLSKESYIYDNIDPQYEFITNFGKELQIGEVIRSLSDSDDTLFLDGFDDLIYWQADLKSPYKYSWYSAFMFTIPMFTQARLDMFAKTPPDFYYGSCPKEFRPDFLLPESIRNDYVRLVSGGNPTCVFIHKKKLPSITSDQWKKANDYKFELPTKEFPIGI